MRSDPRIGLSVCSAIAVAALAWLGGQWIAAGAIFERLGYAMHAITLFSIFTVLAAGAAAGVFWRFARVKAELLAGRRVLARWHVDATNRPTGANRRMTFSRCGSDVDVIVFDVCERSATGRIQ